MRLAIIGVILAAIVGLFAYAGGWLTPHRISPGLVINTFEKADGPHPGFRRNHAKGVCFSGYFESNGRGVDLGRPVQLLEGRVEFALSEPGGIHFVHTIGVDAFVAFVIGIVEMLRELRHRLQIAQ